MNRKSFLIWTCIHLKKLIIIVIALNLDFTVGKSIWKYLKNMKFNKTGVKEKELWLFKTKHQLDMSYVWILPLLIILGTEN